MAAIYSKAEMADITSGLRLEMAESPVIHEGVLRAIAESPHIGSVLSDLWPPGIERPQLDAAARFGDSDAPEIQERVAMALLVVKGVAQYMLGNHEAAIAAFDELIARFGDSGTPEIQTWVASALSCKGLSQTALGRADESLRVCAELDRRLVALSGGGRTMFTWRARWLRAAALLMQGKHPAAMEAFRSAYAEFAPENVTMMREIAVMTIPRLIAVGASEHDLVEILSNDETKSDALMPLIIALRQRMGVEVRAPTEMLEVAKDIRKQIERITATGPRPAS